MNDATTGPANASSSTQARNESAVWRALGGVLDPEMPVVSIVELGIVRDVACNDRECVVTLTPTYSGCPAVRTIEIDARAAAAGATDLPVRVETVLAPPWSSDWIAPEARRKLASHGVAPPRAVALTASHRVDASAARIPCPNCGSVSTEEIARFGSTACKAQHRCRDCGEPFDYFKPH